MFERRFTGVSVGVVVLAILTAACGGGTPASQKGSPSPSQRRLSPAEYVAGVCGAALAWEDAIKTQTTQFQTDSKSASSLDQGKAIFVAYVDQAVMDTETLVTTVGGLAPPAVANGDQIRSALVEALGRIKATFVGAETKAKQIDTSSGTSYIKGVTDIGSEIDSTLSNMGDPLASLPSTELEQAAKADSACQKLESS